MLPPAQRRNASVRGGDWRGDTRAVHQAVQLGRRSYGPDRRGNEGLFKTGDREGRRAHVQHVSRTVPLTVKLSGRVSAPRALQSVFVRKARSAPPYPSLHGPLERWLERTHRPSTVRAPRESGKPQRTSRRVKRAAEP